MNDGYSRVHSTRKNLALHAATVPLFWGGTIALVAAAPLLSRWLAVAGVLTMVAAIGAQGSGHSHESGRPAPFRGPIDVIVRIFIEQWVTFPRFVATGGFSRAWHHGANEVTGCTART